MTLRSEIHLAIDDVARPAPALAHDAVAYVLSNGRRRPERPAGRQPRWAIGVRRAGTFVTAVLVVVMLVTLVVGGRVWRDWTTQQQNGARQEHIAQLRDRPLNLPVVDPGAVCPQTPLNVYQGYYGGYGGGSVGVSGTGQRYGLDSGTYIDTGYWVDSEVRGLVLIRGRDLKTNQSIVFAKSPYPAVRTATPSGSWTGTEVVLGVRVDLYDELLLDASQQGPPPFDWLEAIQGFPTGSSGCVGIQADGLHADGSAFSEVIVVNWLLLT